MQYLGNLFFTATTIVKAIPKLSKIVTITESIDNKPLNAINKQLKSEGAQTLTVAEYRKMDKDAVNKLKHDVAKALLSRYVLPWIVKRGGKPKHIDLIISFACFLNTMRRGKG